MQLVMELEVKLFCDKSGNMGSASVGLTTLTTHLESDILE